MADVTPALVKNLRDRTNAPFGDCKAALTEAAGDIDKAIELLRKKNTAIQAKAAGRETADGRVGLWIAPGNASGGLIELRCESSPVAKNDMFSLGAIRFLYREIVAASIELGRDSLKVGRPREQLREFSWWLHCSTQQGLYDSVELGSVGCGNDRPVAPGPLDLWQLPVHAQAGSSVRAPGQAVAAELVHDGRANLGIRDRHCGDFLAESSDICAQRLKAFHIARIAHVHRGCKRRNTRPGQPLPRGQIVGNRGVGIGSEDYPVDGQSDPACPDAGKPVAKIACRDDET